MNEDSWLWRILQNAKRDVAEWPASLRRLIGEQSFGEARYELWIHMAETHNMHLLESELDEIERLAVAVHNTRTQ